MLAVLLLSSAVALFCFVAWARRVVGASPHRTEWLVRRCVPDPLYVEVEQRLVGDQWEEVWRRKGLTEVVLARTGSDGEVSLLLTGSKHLIEGLVAVSRIGERRVLRCEIGAGVHVVVEGLEVPQAAGPYRSAMEVAGEADSQVVTLCDRRVVHARRRRGRRNVAAGSVGVSLLMGATAGAFYSGQEFAAVLVSLANCGVVFFLGASLLLGGAVKSRERLSSADG